MRAYSVVASSVVEFRLRIELVCSPNVHTDGGVPKIYPRLDVLRECDALIVKAENILLHLTEVPQSGTLRLKS